MDSTSALVQFVDYGNLQIVHVDHIKNIQEVFVKFPPFCISLQTW
jgi:hypothetical protein